jgi:hypothetical protein
VLAWRRRQSMKYLRRGLESEVSQCRREGPSPVSPSEKDDGPDVVPEMGGPRAEVPVEASNSRLGKEVETGGMS